MKKVDEEKEGLLDEIAHLKDRIAALEKYVSESKEIEKSLQDSEEKFKVIMQSAASCIAIYKPVDDGQNFIFVDFNPMAEKAEKISKNKVIGKKVTDVFPGIIEYGLLDVFRNVWKTGKMEHFPASIYKDDRFQGFRDNYVYKLPSGGIIAVYQDLTSRKQEKESLLESEEKFKELADMLPLVVFETDINGNLTFANKQAFENFGYTREMFTNGMNVMQTMLQEDRERAKENILNILKGNKLGSIEYTALKADGTAVPVITYSIPIMKNDQPVGMRGILIDITELKKAEDDLRESENRYRRLFKNSPVPLWELDFTWIIRYFKELKEAGIYDLEEYFTKKPREIIKCVILIKVKDVNEEAINLFKADSKEELLMSYRKIFTEETTPVFINSLLNIRQRKQEFESEVGLQTLKQERLVCIVKWSGSDNQVIISTQDITKRKQADDELKKYREHLEELVKERTQKLEKQKEDLLSMNKVFVGREFRIKELRDEVKELKKKYERRE